MKVPPEVAAAAADLVAQVLEAQVPIELLPPVSMPEHVANVCCTPRSTPSRRIATVAGACPGPRLAVGFGT